MLRAALVALILVAACSGDPAADVARDDSGRPVEAGPVRADRIRAGDCFDDQDDQSPGELPVVPCGERHDNEAFALVRVGGDDWPGQAALTDEAATRCRDEFRRATGAPLDGSGLGIFYLLPSRETWDHDDDRTIVCALFAEDLSKLTGSRRA